jgi:hypothetical protein
MKLAKLLKFGMLVSTLCLTGCASVVSTSNWPVNFRSNPSGAEVVVTDEWGNEVDHGITPATITLHSSSGFFSGATYYADFRQGDLNRKKSIHASINGWYFGNVLFGPAGLILGMVIIDPATGHMFKMPRQCSVDFTDSNSHRNSVGTNAVPVK